MTDATYIDIPDYNFVNLGGFVPWWFKFCIFKLNHEASKLNEITKDITSDVNKENIKLNCGTHTPPT